MKRKTGVVLVSLLVAAAVVFGLSRWGKAEYKSGYALCAAHRSLVLQEFLPRIAQAERDDPSEVEILEKEQKRWIDEVRYQATIRSARSASGCLDGLVQLGQ